MSTAIAHILGLDDASGPMYLWWSGAGADLSYLGALGVGIGWLRKHNCHELRCPRIGRIPIEGSPYVVCHRHHPGAPRSLAKPQR